MLCQADRIILLRCNECPSIATKEWNSPLTPQHTVFFEGLLINWICGGVGDGDVDEDW